MRKAHLGQVRGLVVFFGLFLAAVCFNQASAQVADAYQRANDLHLKILSQPLTPKNPLYSKLTDLVRVGKEVDAIQLLFSQPAFLHTTVRAWAVRYYSAEKETRHPLNDGLAMLVGMVKDNRDFRETLTGDFTYGAIPRFGLDRPSVQSNEVFDRIDSSVLKLGQSIQRIEPQWNVASFTESAGLMTSRSWAERYYEAGTNRRAVVGAFDVFMCTPVESWKTPFLPTNRIRRDIPRDPSGDARIFQQECRSCHAAMDGLAGAFAHLDFQNQSIVFSREVRPKYNNLPDVYPEGYITTDDSWVNYLTVRESLEFGWRGQAAGAGVNQFAQMIAQAEAFSKCTVVRSLKYFCGRDFHMKSSVVKTLAQEFENQDQYRIRDLFKRVLLSEECR